MKPNLHTKTLNVRIRDKHAEVLREWAWAVNQVWNYRNELSFRSISERQTWLSGYDLQDYTKGAGKELGLNSATVQMVGHEYALRRKQFKKNRLSWRKSGACGAPWAGYPFAKTASASNMAVCTTTSSISRSGIAMA